MKISYNWLKKYLDTFPEPEELAELLTFHAFEIEGIENKPARVGGEVGDTVIDVDVLPNRAHDALSHRGIARELATLLDVTLKEDPFGREAKGFPESNTITASVSARDLTRRYQTLVIKGVEVGESPEWLKRKLEILGQRSINNIVDATNYVMLDIGQPLHAFDLKEVGDEILVRRAEKDEKIVLLDGEERILTEDTLVIANRERALGIAGIKGGEYSSVTEKTVDIVLEAANFDPVATRKTSQALKLRTEASSRFENDPSPELTAYALREAAELIKEIAGGEVEGQTDFYPHPEENPEVGVVVSKANDALGTTLSKEEIIALLNRLGFSHREDEGVIFVRAPFERRDVVIEEDLVEEAGRVYGYRKIEGRTLPKIEQKPEVNKRFYYTEKIRKSLIEKGFSEVLTPTFRAENGDVEILNPLASDKKYLRKNLQEGLEGAVELNKKNLPLLGLPAVKIFEIGTVFEKLASPSISTDKACMSQGGEGEHMNLALASSNKREIGPVLKELEGELGVSLGEISGAHFEINLEKLIKNLPEPKLYDISYKNDEVEKEKKYEPITPFPFALRDIAFWVPRDTDEDEIYKLLKENGGALLVRSTLFDRFEKEGRVSYAFHLVFQSKERTLTDDEVNQGMGIIEAALSRRGFEVR
ncbi:MAG: phenylalanine--tRNA ligase subunit beta [Candidatus Paceibacterota bacterium]